MNTGLLIAVILIVIVYVIARSRSRDSKRETQPAVESKPSAETVYQGLRNMVLYGTRERFGLGPPPHADDPWGVVMDWGVPAGTATVMALSDGSASIYLSSGGGYIGGQKEESVRRATLEAIEVAREYPSQMRKTTDYVLPATGEVIFYLMSDTGVFMATEREVELHNPSHSLAKLGNAMQNIVTQYRILEDYKK
ncbi:MAG: hypothetical protein ROO76_05960 [Terriglobia bacterium]|jgi:hypothetical protein|nr:hypothetical protein [Terriglobia bacterium]